MAIRGNVVRGSIVWVNFDPQAGSEQAGLRPAIVISDGLIDEKLANLAVLVPVTNQVKGYAFEVKVPKGIKVNGSLVGRPNLKELSGVALTMHVKSVDISDRDAIAVGQVDPASDFYQQVVSIVRSILA